MFVAAIYLRGTSIIAFPAGIKTGIYILTMIKGHNSITTGKLTSLSNPVTGTKNFSGGINSLSECA
jgi:hypothetical protein